MPLALAHTRLATLAIAVAAAAMWLLLHVYLGIWHDSIIYAMQGLAHLHPHRYDHDIFLRYGSQDTYTIFGSLYAPLIGWLGLDRAAECVTFLSECAFFWFAWRLARRLMPAPLAALAIGMLVVLPGAYGPRAILHVVEDFATPRLFAEALVLGAVLASIEDRLMLAAVLCALATVLHPIMAAAGVALLLWRYVALRRPRMSAGLVGLAMAGLLIAGTLPATAFLRFDPLWLRLAVTPSRFLRLANWTSTDWKEVVLTFGTLGVGAIALKTDPPSRALSIGALVVGIGGLALAALGGDLLHIVLIVQAQVWRWMWFARALATLLLPLMAVRLWQGGPLSRTALLLLVAAYPEQVQNAAATFGLVALALTAAHLDRPRSGTLARCLRFAPYAAAGVLIIYAAAYFVNLAQTMHAARWYDVGSPAFDQVRHLAHSGLLPASLLVLVALLATRWPGPRTLLPLAAAAVLGCLALLPIAVRQWTQTTFSPALIRALRPWRALIPEGSSVLFATGQPIDPLACWVLLERPSYISQYQTVSGLFSRRAALVAHRRNAELAAFFEKEGGSRSRHTSDGPPARRVTLASVCAAAPVRFIATRMGLHAAPIAVIPRQLAGRFSGLKLYRCAP